MSINIGDKASRYVRDEQGRMMRDGKPEPQISYGTGWNACLDALAQQPAADCPDCLNDGCFCDTCNPDQPATPTREARG